jgi:flagellar biosynthesis GTPase FlhF
MTKEQLKEWGLTDEQVNNVWKGLDGSFVTKSRFDEVNTELKQSKDALKERDAQLETLKKSTGDVEALTAKITELQTANKTQAEAHTAELKQMKLDAAVSAALTAVKARNPATVTPLLKTFLEKAEIGEDGKVKGLDTELEKMVKSDDTKFLFDVETKSGGKPNFKGMTPNDSKDGTGSPQQYTSLADAVAAHYAGN